MTESIAVSSMQGPPLAVVAPPSRWVALDLRELWRFRELLLTLAWRDMKLRYRQTFLGVSWVIIQPLIGAGLLTVVFSGIAKMPTGGIPPFLLAFSGMLGWNVFSTTLSKCSTCLIGNAHLVSKVYFPRIALPVSTMFAALIDFGVALPVFVILMFYHHRPPTTAMFLAPVFLLLTLALAQGIGLFASALTVQYRDVQYILPVMTQFLLFACPIAYLVSKIQNPIIRKFYFLNPLSGLLGAFRWSLLGADPVPWGWIAYAAIVTIVLLVAGAYAFRRMEQRFADVI